MEFLFETLQWC